MHTENTMPPQVKLCSLYNYTKINTCFSLDPTSVLDRLTRSVFPHTSIIATASYILVAACTTRHAGLATLKSYLLSCFF